MKRFVRAMCFALALFCCLSAFPVSAADATVSFTLDGQTLSTAVATDGTVTMPAAPASENGVFVGWHAKVNGEDVLLPVGGVCRDVSEAVSFEAVFVDYVTDEGASVRLKDNDVALRFTSSIAKADYDALCEILGKNALSFGTLIVPQAYVRACGGKFTVESLEANGYSKRVDVPAGAFYATKGDRNTVAGSVGKILKGNYTLIYSGIGYMKVTYTDGSVGTVYSAFNQTKNSRSVTRIAFDAYEDRSESYSHLIMENGKSTHSPYTSDEISLLRDFLDCVAMIGITMDKGLYAYFGMQGSYYKTVWGISYTMDTTGGREVATIVITPPDGRTLDDLKGIYLDGTYISLSSTVPNGNGVSFERSSFFGPY